MRQVYSFEEERKIVFFQSSEIFQKYNEWAGPRQVFAPTSRESTGRVTQKWTKLF